MLRDFDGVSEWIRACKYVRPEHVEILAKHEVLRTCEGVGKILLRKPFEVISMIDQAPITPKGQQKSNGNVSVLIFISYFSSTHLKDILCILFQMLKVIHYFHPRCLYQIKSDGLSYEHGIEIV